MNKDIMRGLFSGCNSLWMLGLETSNIQRQRMVKLMKIDDIRRMAHDVVDRCAVESDYIEYKKSAVDAVKDGILKTACAFCKQLYEP